MFTLVRPSASSLPRPLERSLISCSSSFSLLLIVTSRAASCPRLFLRPTSSSVHSCCLFLVTRFVPNNTNSSSVHLFLSQMPSLSSVPFVHSSSRASSVLLPVRGVSSTSAIGVQLSQLLSLYRSHLSLICDAVSSSLTVDGVLVYLAY